MCTQGPRFNTFNKFYYFIKTSLEKLPFNIYLFILHVCETTMTTSATTLIPAQSTAVLPITEFAPSVQMSTQ